jgi:hypothetical protein
VARFQELRLQGECLRNHFHTFQRRRRGNIRALHAIAASTVIIIQNSLLPDVMRLDLS